MPMETLRVAGGLTVWEEGFSVDIAGRCGAFAEF